MQSECSLRASVSSACNSCRTARFSRRELEAAWQRVIALVMQPRVEFNHDNIINYQACYQSCRATSLSALLKEMPSIVYEAHSTDYQMPDAYCDLVRDGFAILKVSPALTFAVCEALMALACIEAEAELLPADCYSNLVTVLEHVKLSDPRHWKEHYHSSDRACPLLRFYCYSDPIYYWNDARAQQAVTRLMADLESMPIPETMLSTWLPNQYAPVRKGALQPHPRVLIQHHIRQVLETYAAACRIESTSVQPG